MGKISLSLALHFLGGGGTGRSLKDPRVIELEVMSSTGIGTSWSR